MRTILILLAILATPSLCLSATLTVPGMFPTIQAAINAAVDGDTVLVDKGTYVENLDFKGKAITVISDEGPDITVIDGGQPVNPNYGSVVLFQSGEGSASVLEGFTITNGTGTKYQGAGWSGYLGGGIFCRNSSSPVIRNNIITKNKTDDPTKNSGGGGIDCQESSSPLIESNIVAENASNLGGGIEAFMSSPTIIRNVITENSADLYGGGLLIAMSDSEILNNTISNNAANIAGGIEIEVCDNPVIKGNTISGNKASGAGGGVRSYNSTSHIDGNTITGNSADKGGGVQVAGSDYSVVTNNLIMENTALSEGGGLRCNQSEPNLDNNLFFGNAANIGGGIDIYQYSVVTATNNTVFGNSANSGGGIACRKDSSAVVTNTILWDNNATQGPEIFLASNIFPSTMDINYSDVDGGQASAVVKSGCTLNWGAGMINANPQFVDSANGDLHLTWPSPCRGTGDNAAVSYLTDFEGDPRIASGTVDMGADEFHTHLYYTGDATPGGSVALKFVGVPGTTPVGFWIAFNVLATPMPGAYGDWWLLPPMLGPIPLPAIPSSGVQILAGTLPVAPPGPYTLYLQAIMSTPLKLTNLCTMDVE